MVVVAKGYKRCSRCRLFKHASTNPAVSEFNRRTRATAQLRSQCKACDLERLHGYDRDHPDVARKRKTEWRRAKCQDPETHAIFKDQGREWYRRTHNVPPENFRFNPGDSHERGQPASDPDAFLGWLRTLGPDAEHIGQECGIDPAQIRKYLSGAIVPTERTVDRAVTFAEQTHRLNDLLPLADTGEDDGIH